MMHVYNNSNYFQCLWIDACEPGLTSRTLVAQSDMTAFGHYTTATEVVQGVDLTGKGAIVTGANSGSLVRPQSPPAG